MEVRNEVKWFADKMEQILKENDSKGGWQNEDLQYLFSRLLEELSELSFALRSHHYTTNEKVGKDNTAYTKMGVMKECIDIANFAMMIADKCKVEWEEINNG